MVCRTMHGWTDATTSRQLATTLLDANNNFICQEVDSGIALGPFCIERVIATTASGTGRLGVLLPARIIVL